MRVCVLSGTLMTDRASITSLRMETCSPMDTMGISIISPFNHRRHLRFVTELRAILVIADVRGTTYGACSSSEREISRHFLSSKTMAH